MTNVPMTATDTVHISSVKADNLVAGEPFEVPKFIAKDLKKRGLATYDNPEDDDDLDEATPAAAAAKSAPTEKRAAKRTAATPKE